MAEKGGRCSRKRRNLGGDLVHLKGFSCYTNAPADICIRPTGGEGSRLENSAISPRYSPFYGASMQIAWAEPLLCAGAYRIMVYPYPLPGLIGGCFSPTAALPAPESHPTPRGVSGLVLFSAGTFPFFHAERSVLGWDIHRRRKDLQHLLPLQPMTSFSGVFQYQQTFS